MKRAWRLLILALLFVSLLLSPAASQNVNAALKGSNNEEKVYNFLRSNMGLNIAAACGIMANMERESHFNPEAVGDSGTSYGICQWHATRKSAMISWCENNGMDHTRLQSQLKFMKHEMDSGAYSSAYNSVRNVPNTKAGAKKAAYYWCVYYEKPANTEATAQSRGNLAKNSYWPKYKNTRTDDNDDDDDDDYYDDDDDDDEKLVKGEEYETSFGTYRYTGNNRVTFTSTYGIFGNSGGLTSLEIPDKVEINGQKCSVTAIDARACVMEYNLTELVIGKNVRSIGKAAFKDCGNLKLINCLFTRSPSVGKNAFSGINEDATFYVKGSIKATFRRAVLKSAPPTVLVLRSDD